MSSYLLTVTPAHGHLGPMLAVARHLVARGDRVRVLTSARHADRVRATGAEPLALPADADVDLDRPDALFPERVGLTGPAAIRFDLIHLFIRPGRGQLAALEAAIAAEPVDAVLTEPLFVGAALLTERPRSVRPPIVAVGIVPLGVKSRDTAPFGLGVPPMRGALGLLRNAVLTALAEKVVFAPVSREADALARAVNGRGISRFVLDWHSGADALVQLTVAGFEYPRRDLPASVRFIGPLVPAGPRAELPVWWDDLEGRRVVHVTQGTVANGDTTQLIGPTLAALADDDVLVVVTTGGGPLDTLPPLPANARAATYLPYDRLLPRTDVLVTNGGYGGVQQALAHGVPIVVAGRTEDKVEVSARVGWAGVGIDLKTNRPDAAAVRAAVRTVLRDPAYRDRARAIGDEIGRAPGLDGLDEVLADLGAPAASAERGIR